ncbi:MAG: hypothetical protein HQL97_07515 [Magnetococcales bacterium]|nr:hypothetical protein [Magnetococcales bacterium]
MAFDFGALYKKAFFRAFCEKTLRADLVAGTFRIFGETFPRAWPENFSCLAGVDRSGIACSLTP